MSTCCPGRIGSGSECPRCRPAVPGHSRLGLKALGVDLQFRATPARVRQPAGLTSCSGVLGSMPKGPRGRTAVPVESGSCLRARGVYQPSQVTRNVPEGPGVEQLSRATRALVGGTEMSTRSPGRLWPIPKSMRARPALPSHSCLGPGARVVDQLSWATQARVQGPAGSTSCPAQLGSGSKVPPGLTQWVKDLALP